MEVGLAVMEVGVCGKLADAARPLDGDVADAGGTCDRASDAQGVLVSPADYGQGILGAVHSNPLALAIGAAS